MALVCAPCRCVCHSKRLVILQMPRLPRTPLLPLPSPLDSVEWPPRPGILDSMSGVPKDDSS
eukprot:scaffold382907_cov16-Prasinocladus_malaysianus.AAC.1